MASKLCDSCKSATATLFCRADSAFLCGSCDSKIHAANKLASRHARVWVCEVCEHAPAHVTCKADAAALCVTCDRDIHSANPLAQRHERVPVTPFFDSLATQQPYYSDADPEAEPDVSQEEAEAASWLLPNPKAAVESPEMNSGQYLFSDMDPYLDLDLEKIEHNSPAADGVVPVQNKAPVVTDHGCFELDFSGSKQPFTYNFSNPNPSLSHSVSSSSLDVGVVPDGSAMADISNPYGPTNPPAVPISAIDREARVLRYREKRKNRKFEKTIRYASRKAYAETRPRIKGRFAKRTDADRTCGYGVVPSF